MSTLLDSALDPERLEDCRRHDAAMDAEHWPTTRTFPRTLAEAFPQDCRMPPMSRCTADACRQGKSACPCPEACHVALPQPTRTTAPAVRRWLLVLLAAAYAAALIVFTTT